jgi:hypothetical protein
MPQISYERAVDFAQDVLENSIAEVLNGIAGAQGTWQGFVLHVPMSDAGLPDVGYIAVPIRLQCASEKTATAQFQMTLTIESAKNPKSFPVFKGRCGVDTLTPSRSNVWLDGNYTVPMKSFGAFFDATLLHGAAERSLRNFLDDVIAACDARINAKEREYLRHHLFR